MSQPTSDGICPTPTKRKFPTEGAAKRGLRALRNPQGQMHPYRCLGHWHLGHGDKVDRDHSRVARR